MLDTIKSVPRRCDRIYVQMPVKILVESRGTDVCYQATTVDFSPLGSRVRSSIGLAPGERVRLILDDSPPQPLSSRVVWTGQDGAGENRDAGLEFLKPFIA